MVIVKKLDVELSTLISGLWVPSAQKSGLNKCILSLCGPESRVKTAGPVWTKFTQN